MATRPVRYELHIRPLMRLIDRDNMIWAFDLWDYDQAQCHADAILQRLQADMPPAAYGGPWPAEWIAVFQRWKDEGFLRLDLGTVDANGYKATRDDTKVTLTGRGTTPTGGYRAWLDAVIPEDQPREYVLYWEPPVPAGQPASTPFRAKAIFQASSAMSQVAVVDANGRHLVPIQSTPSLLSVRGRLEQVLPVLEKLGASHIQTVPVIGGSVSRYRIGSTELEVFSDNLTLDVEGPPDLLAHVKETLGPVSHPDHK
jgi:hypothetical protein